jgi:hypothetical protein
MNSNHDLERRIADYYETEAPSRSAEWLLARTLETIDTTPQRRTVLGWSWRLLPMTAFAKLAVAAVAIVTVGAIGLTLQRPPARGPAAPLPPSPEPSSSPSGLVLPLLTEPFDSTLNEISMDYPAGWRVRPATEPWTGGALNFDSPSADVIFDPALGNRLYVTIASQPFASIGADAWNDGSSWSDICGNSGGGSSGAITVDGAGANVMNCGNGSSGVEITTETRGYLIRLFVSEGELSLRETYDADWFGAALDTVDLHPEETVDEPSPSQSP